jgi:hypothetical protein
VRPERARQEDGSRRSAGGYARHANRPDGWRRPTCSLSAFQIWPQSVQRQYVETLTALLVVVTFNELQKGQALGATDASEGWVDNRLPV